MNLKIFHGRWTPDEEMDDWGFDGPVLTNIQYGHITYCEDMKVFFKTKEACEAAQARTGWRRDEENTLLAYIKDGMLCVEWQGRPAYFGDWSFYDS
jgi:hypothetical protein